MEALIALVVGYLIGTRSGSWDFKEIGRAWEKIKRSEEAQDFVAGTADMGLQLYRRLGAWVLRPFTPRFFRR